MAERKTPQLDEIGPWTEVKLEILKRYAVEYSKILSAQTSPELSHSYIDAFAGAGVHISRTQDAMVLGSPVNALLIDPPFKEYFLIDLDESRIEGLSKLAGARSNVRLYQGDCNKILLSDVFPKVRFEDYKRGLCILDPYKLNLEWNVIREAGRMKSIDLFINFPMMDINRNVLRRDPTTVALEDELRMTALWGDDSWREFYSAEQHLFGISEKIVDNDAVAEKFRQRLQKIAGFQKVPKPLPMRNAKNAVLYYLFFASQKGTAEDIVKYIVDNFGRT